MGKHPAVRDARNYAAAELFRLTGEPQWNALFVATTEFTNPGRRVPYHWDSLDQADAAWVYARTDRPGMNETIKQNCRAVLIREADTRRDQRRSDRLSLGQAPLSPGRHGSPEQPRGRCVAWSAPTS